mmetsp:Transcript_19283/g.41452  ORF Transcript_19283/g.41452 Transcript_19283/m.41452 type:complete len:330 (-) Transcript_19283:64-1053(-)|eukprot:CAMPEP_0168798566 /NCGR_PEP_ID=MMETSP0725-20121227/17959_1 /TAXON_ID=265536 /ORGANISM="Amphiprora sp., Strain CCMP467" /LENGTH=329 /DNA_ID=CAMNT_0008849961 /DNA_START=51 /DNA_END=1040 /DNA_ORIENTATION=+
MWLLGQKIDVLRNQQGLAASSLACGGAVAPAGFDNVAAALLNNNSASGSRSPPPDFPTQVVGNPLNESSDPSKLQATVPLDSLLGSHNHVANQLKQLELAYRGASAMSGAIAPTKQTSSPPVSASLMELAAQRQLLEEQQKVSIAARLVSASFPTAEYQGRSMQNNTYALAALTAVMRIKNQSSVSSMGQQQDLIQPHPQESQCSIAKSNSLGLDHVHRSKQSFPEKVYFMLEEVYKTGDDSIVSFVDDGKAFLIHKPRSFETDVMPLFFASRRMSSFQRQLNIYGFQRINDGPFRGAYKHNSFIRGQKDLLSQIKRIEKHCKPKKQHA